MNELLLLLIYFYFYFYVCLWVESQVRLEVNQYKLGSEVPFMKTLLQERWREEGQRVVS